MAHFMPNFGLFILAIVFFVCSMAIPIDPKLKCTLPSGATYTCDDGLRPADYGRDECCCNRFQLGSNGCPKGLDEAIDWAIHHCMPNANSGVYNAMFCCVSPRGPPVQLTMNLTSDNIPEY